MKQVTPALKGLNWTTFDELFAELTVRKEIYSPPSGTAFPCFIRQPWVPLRFTHGYLKFAPFGDSAERRRCSITITVGGAFRGTHGYE
jgi:hypothetical protein